MCYAARVRFIGICVLSAASVIGGCTTTVVAGKTTTSTAAAPGDPPAECAAGTMPSLASAGCAPVGPTSCAGGFATSDSGWGCAAIVPESACTGITRGAIGKTSCEPIDDCSGAFPPAGATVVTDDASLSAALANARSGATLALEAGTYAGFEVPRDMTVVGRCASKVTIKGTGTRGIYVTNTRKVTLAGMTVEGFQGGIVAAWGPTVEASRIVVRNADAGFVAGEATLHVTNSIVETTAKSEASAFSAQAGGKIVVEDTEVRGYETAVSAYEKDTDVTLRRSIVRYDGSTRGATLFMTFGSAHVLVDESALRWRIGALALVGRDLPGVPSMDKATGGHLEFKNTHARQSGAELDRPLSKIIEGGHITLEGATVEHQSHAAFMAGDAGSTLTVKSSVIRSVAQSQGMRNAIWALHGGIAEVEGSAIVSAQENALAVANDGSRLTFTKSLVHDTLAGTEETDPQFGASGIALFAGAGGTASVVESAFVASRNLAVLAGEGAQVEVARSVIDATSMSPELTGGAAICAADARVTVDQSLVRKSQDAALVFLGGDAIVKRTRFVGHPVGVHLGGGHIVEASADPAIASPGELVLFQNVFEGTEVMVREAPYEPPTEPAPLSN